LLLLYTKSRSGADVEKAIGTIIHWENEIEDWDDIIPADLGPF
jgi:hypothetical protein